MENENQFSERDSLKLIAEMIQQAKAGYYHDSGLGPILWGSMVSIAGYLAFLTLHFNWDIDFDWWLLLLVAFVPQYFISRRERQENVVKTHVGRALDVVWLLYGVSIFAVLIYLNMAPLMAEKFLQENGYVLMKQATDTGELTEYRITVAPSPGSLLLLLFAFPTMVTGAVQRFKPMIFGALLTYIFFIISIFTRNPIDQFLMGTAGLFNWLIPGLLLRKKYLEARKHPHV